MDPNDAPSPTPIADVTGLLRRRAAERPDQPAFVFVTDARGFADGSAGSNQQWSYAELDARARAIAEVVADGRQRGDRALLAFPPGLDFIAAFFGCLYAGILPVPATYPRPRRASSRLDAIAEDCDPSVVLANSATLAAMPLGEQSPQVAALPWIEVDKCGADGALAFDVTQPRDAAAFLQYTSGSTSQPRGVIVSHGNLLHNLELIRSGFGLRPAEEGPVQTGVFWLPAYHDMGLVGGILTPIYVGGTSYLLPPAAFLQRPASWLEVLSRTRAEISGAPNFAFDLCVRKTTFEQRSQLDLSRWRLAFCGAEPIDAGVLTNFAEAFSDCGFRQSAFYPCYGLAEATLMVTGGAGPAAPHVMHADRTRLAANELATANSEAADSAALVSCGRALGDLEMKIVDPHARTVCRDGEVGEIWVRGDSVAQGYWNGEEANRETFGGQLASGEAGYLRTGDLGAVVNGQLYVTGRLKDLIIIRGRNLYPQDVERTSQLAHEAIDQGAAFAVVQQGNEELAVLHQVSREHRRSDLGPVLRAIRSAVVDEFEIDPAVIMLLRPGALPLTSSGKVQRSRCREMLLAGQFEELAAWRREPTLSEEATLLNLVNGANQPSQWRADPTGATNDAPHFLSNVEAYTADGLADEIEAWMMDWIFRRTADAADGPITPEATFAELGMDSLTAIELNVDFERVLGLRLAPGAAWSFPTPRLLSRYLAESMLGLEPAECEAAARIPVA